MKKVFVFCGILLAGIFLLVKGQHVFKKELTEDLKNEMTMEVEKLNHPVVKKAIQALQHADSKAWFALFTADAQLFDDGSERNFKRFFEKAIGSERFLSIDKVADDDRSIYGRFHSDTWGDFKTYFKFQINENGKIIRLDIGQAKY